MKRVVFLLILILSLPMATIAYAGFDDGKAAYDRGDYATAYKEFKVLAEQGHAGAQRYLGVMYHEGHGVPQDYGEDAKWTRKAANQGDAKAQFNLGQMCLESHGVPKDYAEAFKWYRKAADQGLVEGQFALGLMYYFDVDRGVPQDYGEAAKWFRKAADQGDARSQYYLGRMYDFGDGLPRDAAEALKCYRKAAEQGDAKAQTALKRWLTTEVPLESGGSGVYELPVRINGVLTLKFILDTGASEVNIPADVASTLLRTGTITESDFLPGQLYELADGSILKSSRFTIRELDLGGIRISQVPASVGPANGSLLLGQSFLGRLESWSMDNKRHVLIIGAGAVQP